VTSSTSAPLVGALLAGRYAIERHLARGGMSDVYQATDQVLHRPVAVKVYRAGATHDRARFDAEIRVLAGLSHPGLVQVYDAGEHDGDGFVVLELVEGPTLRTVLGERGQLPSEDCARLGAEVADALAYIHASGVVHRDVNPSNVLCGPDGRARLADFGIARLIDTTRITAPVDAIGTAPYMAPEQVRGEDVTPAADVYALGLVLAELLLGRPVFGGPAHEAAMARLAHDPDLTGILGPWRDALVEMTQREPDARPSAELVRDRLAGLVGSVTPATAVAVGAGEVAVTDAVAAVDPLAQTVTVAAVPSAGGTTVMPAALAPNVPRTDAGGPEPRGRRRGLWLALAAVVLVLIIGLAATGGGETV
jgi:serine/threonine protein kinase